MDVSCPECKTTKRINPKMKLMVSKCGHSLCENCLEKIFSKGLGLCPTCKTELKKANFRPQVYEDPAVEMEIDIRKRLQKDFNRKEQDFETLDAYNDYLEMVETYIFNLVNRIDVEETEREIAAYRESNKDLIGKNRGKLSKDELFIELLVEQERTAEAMRKRVHDQEIQEEREAKQRVKEELMSALMRPDANVDQVLKKGLENLEAKRDQKAAPIMPNMIQQQDELLLSLSNEQTQQRLFVYEPPKYDHQGPRIPDKSDLEQYGYLDYVRQERSDERAGGYTREYPCMRAVQEAFDMLLFVKEPTLAPVKREPMTEAEAMET